MILPRVSGPIFTFAVTSLIIGSIYLYSAIQQSSFTLGNGALHSMSYAAALLARHPPSLVKPRLIGRLPFELAPTKENGRRLVFVGDIHGMIDELNDLLETVKFDPARDHLVALGDMINKGTNSSAVISRLMELGASAVRGNHEDHVLNAWVEDKKGSSSWFRKKEPAKHRHTARSLSADQLDWIAKLPVILTTNPLPIYAVHGGLVPGVQLQFQKPWAVMNMRTLLLPRKKHSKDKARRSDDEEEDDAAANGTRAEDSPAEVVLNNTIPHSEEVEDDNDESEKEGEKKEDEEDDDIDVHTPPVDYSSAVPIDGRDGIKWTKAWNTYQKRLRKVQRHTVVYGHDAKRGYRVGKYTYGLDSNCVGGGALTALVVEATKHSFKHKTFHVSCKTEVKKETSKEDV